MERTFPEVKFERYADDIVIHCETREQSEQIERVLAARLQECELSLHPEKTKVVYCKDESRKGWYPTKKFTLLGYTFQPRSHLDTGTAAPESTGPEQPPTVCSLALSPPWTSRMIGGYHVRFCEGLGGEIPPVYSANSEGEGNRRRIPSEM
jgi:hypothetical protein